MNDAPLSFGTAVDTSGFDDGISKIENKLTEVGDKAEVESARISQLLSDVPTVNIDVVTNASQSLETITRAYEEIDRVVGENEAGIRELEAEYARLGNEANAAYKKGTEAGDNEFRAIQRQQSVIKQVINERKNVVKAASEQADELLKVETNLKKEAEAAQKAASAHVSLRTQIRNLKEEMADAIANGIDEQSEAYKEMVNELGRLQDIQGDIAAQGNVLANDEQQWAGAIQGLNGLVGGFTAAQGAVSLFAGENEDLQRIMLKVQSLMSITMGLQQVQQTLNKDSAFSLVTLNGLKEWWNELLVIGAGAQEVETAATIADTAANTANAASTAADTAAQVANNTATQAGTAITGANTAGQVVNTGAAAAGTVANIGLAGAFRMVGAAIKSIPIFGWIAAAIGALIGVISHFVSKANEVSKAAKERNELLKESRKVFANASVEIKNYQNRIDKFKGTKAQEKKLVEELNGKYGEAMGYYNSLDEWKKALIKKGGKYCEMLMKEAEAQAILTKYTEAYINLQEVKEKAKAGDYDHWYTGKKGDEKARQKAIAEAKNEMDKWKKQYEDIQNELIKFKQDNDLNYHADPTSVSSKKGSATSFDPQKAALKEKQTVEEFKKSMREYFNDAYKQISEYELDAMTDGQDKQLRQIELNTAQKQQAWRQQLLSLAQTMKNAEKEVYMSKKGATEVGWANSVRGKMSLQDYADELMKNKKLAEDYNTVMVQIIEQGERQKNEVRQRYNDKLINQYGTLKQKEELLLRQWGEKLSSIPLKYLDAAIEQMEAEFEKLDTEKLKDSINWETVFNDLDKMSVSYLTKLRGQLETFLKTHKDLSIESIKEITTKMHDIDAAIVEESDTFGVLIPKIEEYKRLKQEAADAQQILTDAVNQQAEAESNLDAVKQQIADEVANSGITIDFNSIKSANQKDLLNGITDTKSLKKLNKLFEELAQKESKVAKATEKKVKAQTNADEAEDKAHLNLKERAAIAADALNMVSEKLAGMSDLLDEIGLGESKFGKAVKNVGNGVSSAAGAFADFSTGNYLGAAVKGISSIKSFGKALGIGGGNAAEVQKAINELTSSNKALETAVKGLTEKMNEANGAESIKYYKKAYEAQKKIDENYRKILDEQMHYSSAHHSNSYYWNLNDGSLRKINELLGTNLANSWGDFSRLTADQMNEIRTNLPEIWREMINQGKYGSRFEQDWNNYADQAGKLQELTEAINENLLQISFQSLRDSFVSELMDMETDAQHFSNKFKEIMQRALLNSTIGNKYDAELKKWYDELGKKMQDSGGKLNESQIDYFRKWYDDMIAGMMEERDQIAEITGYDGGKEDEERQGTKKGIATASQDSVDENNARLTTIQGHTYSLVQGMNELNRTGNAILEKVAGIERNTSETNIKLNEVSSKVSAIKNSVDDIAIKGIRIKP